MFTDAADMRQFLVGKYAYLQHYKMVDRTCVQDHIKCGLVEPLLQKVKNEIVHRLGDLTRDKEYLTQVISTVMDVHAEIETDWKEEHTLKSIISPVAPVKRMLIDNPGPDGQPQGPRRGDYVYDVPIEQQLKQLLGNNRAMIQVSSYSRTL